MSEYVYDTKEDFLERLETWEENGQSSEDIDAVREKVRQYDEDDVLIIWCSCPVKYLCYYRENQDDLPRVYGSYDYQKGEQSTKIYVYITDYEEKIFQWQWGQSYYFRDAYSFEHKKIVFNENAEFVRQQMGRRALH